MSTRRAEDEVVPGDSARAISTLTNLQYRHGQGRVPSTIIATAFRLLLKSISECFLKMRGSPEHGAAEAFAAGLASFVGGRSA